MKELAGLPRPILEQVDARIQALATNPRPLGCKALQGGWRGYTRIRSGDYRIIYRIEDDRLIVMVVKVGNRRDIYD